MRRFALALFLALLAIIPAQATELLLLPITTAVNPALSANFQLRLGPGVNAQNMSMQAALTYGSGGTTIDAYVQTSFDGGGTWADIANFHFTTSSLRLIQNVSAVTGVVAAVTALDGGLTANTAVSGMFGSLWRVKVISVGTYATTTLRVDAIAVGLTTP